MSRNALSENLLSFVPFLYKKLSKGIPVFEVSRQQFELLYNINEKSGMPMKYYCNTMMISKSNLTVLSDKLIEEGFIERQPDPEDRRVIILEVTKKGQKYLQKEMNRVKDHMLERLEVFSDQEVQKLNELFNEMKQIFDKLDEHQI